MFWPFKKQKKQSKIFEELSGKLENRKSKHVVELKEKHKSVLSWAKKKGISAEDVVQKSAKGLAADLNAAHVVDLLDREVVAVFGMNAVGRVFAGEGNRRAERNGVALDLGRGGPGGGNRQR